MPSFAASLTLVAFGDSLTAGYGLPASQAFPAVLERELKARGYDVRVVNAGVSGDTASAGQSRLEWSVPREAHGVIVELGANDALRGVDPAITRKALEDIITRLQARGQAVLLAGMYAPRQYGAEYIQKFDAIYPELAQKKGIPLYPFFLEGIVGNRSLNLPDGIHPNAEGVKRIVATMLPSVEAFVQNLQNRDKKAQN